MSVAQQPARNTSMSMEAMELITCFYDGVDEVVRELAEEIAVRRNSYLEDGCTVAIEKEDVQQAGKLVVDAIRQMVAEQQLPIDLESATGMAGCFDSQE